MITAVKIGVVNGWSFIFDHRVSPLRIFPMSLSVTISRKSRDPASLGAYVGGQFLCRDRKLHISCGQHTGSCGLDCGCGGHGSHVYGRSKAAKTIDARSGTPPRWRA
jgi:hypothetical protein